MKTYFEGEIFTIKPRQFKHKNGTGTSFSFMLQGDKPSESEDAPVVWISAVSFSDEIKEKRRYLVRGYLQVKPPWNDRPAGLQLVITEAFELGSSQYTVRTKRLTQSTDQNDQQPKAHSTSNGMNDPSPNQARQHHSQGSNMQEPPVGGGEYIDGNGIRQSTFPDMAQSEEIPFAPIGMSEGGFYALII